MVWFYLSYSFSNIYKVMESITLFVLNISFAFKKNLYPFLCPLLNLDKYIMDIMEIVVKYS